MEYIIVIAIIVFIASVLQRQSDKLTAPLKEGHDNVVTVFKKQCPPHQWFWQEIVDQDGNRQGERIVCKVCGPLSKSLDGSVE